MVFNNSRATMDTERRLGLYDDITAAEDKRLNQPGVNGRAAIWGTPRRSLSVGVSKDEGQNWEYRVLEDGDGWCMSNNSKEKANRELSYPSMIVNKDTENGIHLTYTYHRQNIRYVCIADVRAFVHG